MADTNRKRTDTGQPKIVATDSEYTISVIGLTASFCSQPVVGLILCAIALKRSKQAGRYNKYAHIGFILSIILTSLWLMMIVLYVIGFIALVASGRKF